MILLIIIAILAIFGGIIIYFQYKNKKLNCIKGAVVKYNTRGNVRGCVGLVTQTEEFEKNRNYLKKARF